MSFATSVRTIPLFSIPITLANFGEGAKFLNKQLIADSLKEMSLKPDNKTRSAVGAWQSTSDMEERYESFSILSQNISKVICSTLAHYGYTHDQSLNDELFKCESLWVNILSDIGAYHRPHIHGTGATLFSGVYYPTSGLTHDNEEYYPDEDWSTNDIHTSSSASSGDLVLFDPSSAIKSQVVPRHVTKYPYYGYDVFVKPKKSHLIVFPNYLSHMVAPITQSNFKRMSISFSFSKNYSNIQYHNQLMV